MQHLNGYDRLFVIIVYAYKSKEFLLRIPLLSFLYNTLWLFFIIYCLNFLLTTIIYCLNFSVTAFIYCYCLNILVTISYLHMLLTRSGWLLSCEYESLAWLSTAAGVILIKTASSVVTALATGQTLKDEIIFFLFLTNING